MSDAATYSSDIGLVTINVGGLNKEGYDELAQWLNQPSTLRNVQIVFLQETWRSASEFSAQHWHWILSGAGQTAKANNGSGVAVLINNQLASSSHIRYQEWVPGRLLEVRITEDKRRPLLHRPITLVCAYQHSRISHSPEVYAKRLRFWEKLQKCLDAVPARHTLMFGGDINTGISPMPRLVGMGAQVSTNPSQDQHEWQDIVQQQRLCLLNTWGPPGRAATYVGTDYSTLIDYLGVRERDQPVDAVMHPMQIDAILRQGSRELFPGTRLSSRPTEVWDNEQTKLSLRHVWQARAQLRRCTLGPPLRVAFHLWRAQWRFVKARKALHSQSNKARRDKWDQQLVEAEDAYHKHDSHSFFAAVRRLEYLAQHWGAGEHEGDEVKQQTLTLHERRQGAVRTLCTGGAQLTVDCSKAFDSLPRSTMMTMLTWAGVPPDLATAILQVHQAGTYRHGNVDDPDSWKDIDSAQGVRQGCMLAPCLWLLFVAYLFHHLDLTMGEEEPWTGQHSTAFPDDLHFKWDLDDPKALDQMKLEVATVLSVLKSFGLQISAEKSTMLIEIRGTAADIWLSKNIYKDAENHRHFRYDTFAKLSIPLGTQFKYLGVILSYRNYELASVKHRVQQAAIHHSRLRRILQGRGGISRSQRLRLWRICIQTSQLYGLEATGVTEAGIKLLHVQMLRHLRAITGRPRHLDRSTDQELLDSLKMASVRQMLSQRLQSVHARINQQNNAPQTSTDLNVVMEDMPDFDADSQIQSLLGGLSSAVDLKQLLSPTPTPARNQPLTNKRPRAEPWIRGTANKGSGKGKGTASSGTLSPEDLQQLLKQIVILLLRQGDQLNRLQTDTGYYLVFQVPGEATMVPVLIAGALEWRNQKKADPTKLTMSLRIALIGLFLKELQMRLEKIRANDQLQEKLKEQGLLTDEGAWTYRQWCPKNKALQLQLSRDPIKWDVLMTHITNALQGLNTQDHITRFQATKALEEGQTGPTLPFLLDISLKPSACRLHQSMRALVDCSAMEAIGARIRPQRAKRSQLQDHLQQWLRGKSYHVLIQDWPHFDRQQDVAEFAQHVLDRTILNR
ncbi:Pol [Symbiodinium sp. CCMP2592]|nr:Pol [Symbiodinium sp. CCMP2592]